MNKCIRKPQPEKRIAVHKIDPEPLIENKSMPAGFFNLTAILLFFFFLVSGSCTSTRYFGKTSIPGNFLNDPAISDTHVGVAIYDAGSEKYIYTHNSDKFFLPASNIKLATLYAGLKYLGDSIPGMQYSVHNDTVYLFPTGDPTFMLLDFPVQPVLDFLINVEKPVVFIEPHWRTGSLGYGWPWNFYLDYYMPERSPFPIYGNGMIWAQKEMAGLDEDVMVTLVSSYPRHPWQVEIKDGGNEKFEVIRPVTVNDYTVYPGLEGDREMFVPFATNGMQAALELLKDTLKKDIMVAPCGAAFINQRGLPVRSGIKDFPFTDHHSGITVHPEHPGTIYSRPADSLFRPMMHYSDNFYAEQTLLMISQKLFGVMDETLLIDYLLENDFKYLPHPVRWVDGSGLSRYNLFTPESIVWLLGKMKDEYGFDRTSRLLPTGGEGTLKNHYMDEKRKIYAKTGTLGGNAVSLSGYIVTKGGRNLIFSVLVNNHYKASDEVRSATESFLKEIIRRY